MKSPQSALSPNGDTICFVGVEPEPGPAPSVRCTVVSCSDSSRPERSEVLPGTEGALSPCAGYAPGGKLFVAYVTGGDDADWRLNVTHDPFGGNPPPGMSFTERIDGLQLTANSGEIVVVLLRWEGGLYSVYAVHGSGEPPRLEHSVELSRPMADVVWRSHARVALAGDVEQRGIAVWLEGKRSGIITCMAAVRRTGSEPSWADPFPVPEVTIGTQSEPELWVEVEDGHGVITWRTRQAGVLTREARIDLARVVEARTVAARCGCR